MIEVPRITKFIDRNAAETMVIEKNYSHLKIRKVPITGIDSEVGGVTSETIPRNTVTDRRLVISEIQPNFLELSAKRTKRNLFSALRRHRESDDIR